MSKIVAVDIDSEFLTKFVNKCNELGIDSDVFTYPDDLKSFRKKVNTADYVLVSHKLGGFNGANFARELISQCIRGAVILISQSFDIKYSSFDYYLNKEDLLDDPSIVLDIKDDIVGQAVEMSVMSQKRI